VCMHNLDELIASLDHLDPTDLDSLQAAIDSKRHKVSVSSVVKRRNHLDGILQLEYRTNPKTGTQRGPYWYFKYRKDGKQKTTYIGSTNDPEGWLENRRAIIGRN
jgi:hypothetical protein